MATLIKIAQLVIAAALIVLVLLQERGSGISESFGGSGEAGFYQHRRGLEKVIFTATLIGLALFAGTSLASLFIR